MWIPGKISAVASMAKDLPIKSIGKGELFWAAMGIAASTIFELSSIRDITTNATLKSMAGWAIAGHISIMFIAVMMIGFNSLEPPPPPLPPAGGVPPPPPPPPPPPSPIRDPFVFRWSIYILLFVIATYTFTHTQLTQEEASIRKAAIIKAKECMAGNKNDVGHCMEGIK